MVTGKKISYKAVIGWSLLMIGFIMLCNSIRLCFSKDIWYDELFTVGMVEHSYGEFIRFTAKDVHPPLYYCIAKIVVDLWKLIVPAAETVMIIKLVSVMPYFLLLVYALPFLRRRFGIFPAGVFFFCIMSMPQMSAYTVEMRMYGFALLFVSAAFFHAYAIVCPDECEGRQRAVLDQSVCASPKRRLRSASCAVHYAALTVYGLAAAYTQYFACVAVIMIYACLFVWFGFHRWKRQEKEAGKMLRNLSFCVLASIIGYLPWFFVLLSQINTVRSNYWILPLTWRSLGGCVKFLMKPAFTNEKLNVVYAVVMFLIYVMSLAGFGYRVLKPGKIRQEKQEIRFFYAFAGCVVLCGLVGFGFAASFLIRPIFVYRYMLPAMGCFWFCFALCLDSYPDCDRWAGRLPFGRIFGIGALIVVTVAGLRCYRAFMGEEEYKIVLMKETQDALAGIAAEDIVIYNFDQLQAVAGYYGGQRSYLWNGEAEALIEEIFGEKGSVSAAQEIKEWLACGKNVWFVGSFNSREDIRTQWEADGIYTEEMGSFLLERYWFNIYRLSVKENVSFTE